ncbi:protein-L-isoaspartate O-methyltransferase, partial [Cupriavidus sp. GA3-3]
MSTTPPRNKFPLPLDAVVERKPAPARTAGLPAVGTPRPAAPTPAPA